MVYSHFLFLGPKIVFFPFIISVVRYAVYIEKSDEREVYVVCRLVYMLDYKNC